MKRWMLFLKGFWHKRVILPIARIMLTTTLTFMSRTVLLLFSFILQYWPTCKAFIIFSFQLHIRSCKVMHVHMYITDLTRLHPYISEPVHSYLYRLMGWPENSWRHGKWIIDTDITPLFYFRKVFKNRSYMSTLNNSFIV